MMYFRLLVLSVLAVVLVLVSTATPPALAQSGTLLPGRDFPLAGPDVRSPYGIWTNGTTVWLSNLNGGNIYAFDADDAERNMSLDIDTVVASQIRLSWIAGSGTTIWAANAGTGKVLAYNTTTGARDSSLDVDLGAASTDFSTNAGLGGYTDGTTLWVLGALRNQSNSIFSAAVAFTISTGVRDLTKDVLTTRVSSYRGLSFDGTYWYTTYRSTIRVFDGTGALQSSKYIAAGSGSFYSITAHAGNVLMVKQRAFEVLAYSTTTRAAVPERNISKFYIDPTGNLRPEDAYASGGILWVSDLSADKVYAYQLSDGSRRRNLDFNVVDTTGRILDTRGMYGGTGNTIYLTGAGSQLLSVCDTMGGHGQVCTYIRLSQRPNSSTCIGDVDIPTAQVMIGQRTYELFNYSTGARNFSVTFPFGNHVSVNSGTCGLRIGNDMLVFSHDHIVAFDVTDPFNLSYSVLAGYSNLSMFGIYGQAMALDSNILWIVSDISDKVFGLRSHAATALSNDASLSELATLPPGIVPTFDSATLAYTLDIVEGQADVLITPTVSDVGAVFQISLGALSAAPSEAARVLLGSGTFAVDIAVTAADGTTIRTYTLTITKAGSANPGSEMLVPDAAVPVPTLTPIPPGEDFDPDLGELFTDAWPTWTRLYVALSTPEARRWFWEPRTVYAADPMVIAKIGWTHVPGALRYEILRDDELITDDPGLSHTGRQFVWDAVGDGSIVELRVRGAIDGGSTGRTMTISGVEVIVPSGTTQYSPWSETEYLVMQANVLDVNPDNDPNNPFVTPNAAEEGGNFGPIAAGMFGGNETAWNILIWLCLSMFAAGGAAVGVGKVSGDGFLSPEGLAVFLLVFVCFWCGLSPTIGGVDWPYALTPLFLIVYPLWRGIKSMGWV